LPNSFNFFLLVASLVLNSSSTITLAQNLENSPEVEAENLVGTVNRSQQAYHFERQEFASSVAELGLSFDLERYQQPVIQKTDQMATVMVTTTEENLRSFAGATTYDQGIYSQIICVTLTPSKTIQVPMQQGTQLTCAEGSTEIR
jgi:type IV pilus assembly protein PilA